jgi:ABC-type branched-subunit amino acid transport system substrate-binding protein
VTSTPRQAKLGEPRELRQRSWVVLLTILTGSFGCSRVAPPPSNPKSPEVDSGPNRSGFNDSEAGRLGPDEARGKTIYTRGVNSSGGEIPTVLGESAAAVPAAVLRCVNCHGHDGVGRPEGGIVPPEITWRELTRPYGESHPSGRRRPAYTPSLLGRAISMGIDSGGKPLNFAMPRYRLTHGELADLTAYLKRLGTEWDPGITPTALRIGVILPPQTLPEMRRAVREPLTAYFAELNDAGGIYDRRIELEFIEPPDPVSGHTTFAESWLRNENVFAHLATFMAGMEAEFVEAAADFKIPVIGPLTLYPETGFPLNRSIFYVYSGIDEQAAFLATFADKHRPPGPRSFAIFHSDDPHIAGIIPGLEDKFRGLGWGSIEAMCVSDEAFDMRATTARMSNQGVQVVMLLGVGRRIDELLAEADRLHWHPMILIPGSLSGRLLFEAPPGFDGRIFLSFPQLPPTARPDGKSVRAALNSRHRLPDHHTSTQAEVLTAAAVLGEGLIRTGRIVSREAFVEQMEKIHEFVEGLDRPVSYGPNRRVGSPGAYVVAVDLRQKRLVPASGWINSDTDPHVRVIK